MKQSSLQILNTTSKKLKFFNAGFVLMASCDKIINVKTQQISSETEQFNNKIKQKLPKKYSYIVFWQ